MSHRSGFLALTCAGLSFSLTGTLGCSGDDDASFIPLSELCSTLANDICEARNGGCCPAGDPLACAMSETASCTAAIGAFTAESSLRYDAVAAFKQRDTARAVLDMCGGQPTVSLFFVGGLPTGNVCERSGQCLSGSCSPDAHVCVDPVSAPLCPAPAAP